MDTNGVETWNLRFALVGNRGFERPQTIGSFDLYPLSLRRTADGGKGSCGPYVRVHGRGPSDNVHVSRYDSLSDSSNPGPTVNQTDSSEKNGYRKIGYQKMSLNRYSGDQTVTFYRRSDYILIRTHCWTTKVFLYSVKFLLSSFVYENILFDSNVGFG